MASRHSGGFRVSGFGFRVGPSVSSHWRRKETLSSAETPKSAESDDQSETAMTRTAATDVDFANPTSFGNQGLHAPVL